MKMVWESPKSKVESLGVFRDEVLWSYGTGIDIEKWGIIWLEYDGRSSCL